MTSEDFHEALQRERFRRESVENDNRRRKAAIVAQRRHFNDWQWSLIKSALLTPNDRVEGRDAASSRRVPSHDGLAGNVTTKKG